ncbi:MAG: type I 3-dehydroquinate dehydratase, partial [Acidobacteria bacterium]|nr:type I 3-dehydroquinate dehydratase [Acidobacteriota bacterium]
MAKSAFPHIFVSLPATSLDAVETYISSLGASPSLGFELRLDYLGNYDQLEPELHQMLSRLHYPHTIATCRRLAAGGRFPGSANEQLDILAAASRAGCQWVDIEIESVGALRNGWIKQLASSKVIVSYHNYHTTPALGAVYRKLARLPVEVVKIASSARNLQDNLKIYKL